MNLSLKVKSLHVRLETLRRFLTVDVNGAAELEEKLVSLQTGAQLDQSVCESAARALRSVVAERAEMLAVQPVQRAETVLAVPWELGSSSEYGHMNLLYRMLTEAEKLDVAENSPNAGAGDVVCVVNRFV